MDGDRVHGLHHFGCMTGWPALLNIGVAVCCLIYIATCRGMTVLAILAT